MLLYFLAFCILSLYPAHSLRGPPNIFADLQWGYVEKIIRNAKSSELLNYMNKTNDPCADFYNFACGNYHKINPPSDLVVKSTFHDLAQGFQRKLLSVIEPHVAAGTLHEMNVKNFYESCENLSILKTTYGAKLSEIINEFGRMPILEGNNWHDSYYFDWLRTVAEINRKYGIRIILGTKVNVNVSNGTENIVYITTQDEPLGYETRVKRIQSIVYNLIYLLDIEAKVAEAVAVEISNVETELFNALAEIKFNIPESYDPFPSIDFMHRKYYPYIDIKRLVNISLGFIPSVLCDDIHNSAQQIIGVLKQTPHRILANYVFYNLIERFVLIPDPANRNMVNFMDLANAEQKYQLQMICVRETEKHFTKILYNKIYHKYITKDTESAIQIMWQTIKSVTHNILALNGVAAISDVERQIIKEQLNTLNLHINSYENTNFAQEFEGLIMNKHDFVENMKSILIFYNHRQIAKLNRSSATGEDEQNDQKLSSIPFYYALENTILIPVSILQSSYLWSDYYPNAMKFSTLGFLISRLIIQVFDNEWLGWQEDFGHNASVCFNEQYYNNSHREQSSPQLLSQSENIADAGGLHIAYNAYKQWCKGTVDSRSILREESLPHLNYDDNQLFFISFGQMWCSTGVFLSQVDQNVALDIDRITTALSNLEEFSIVFQCVKDSRMNPTRKCSIF